MSRVVLASGNKGKVREMNALLAPTGLEVLPQTQFGVAEAVEDGLTFVENALIKARNACRHTGLAAIADDSGLEIDALQGAPGIYSARFAGEGADDTQNWQKVLEELEGIPLAERGARFQCLLVYLRHAEDPTPVIAQGSWQGTILESPAGENGFGYDPIFFLPDQRCSAAQLAPELKNSLSHRGQALQRLLQLLSARS
ncbi:MAG: RdgB/HAM1 family non-canonical purine NTP pyrophosphatase [Gammaproteobacteria bacterium]|nr:RdgB/HAM1 family non-canonical purine NTP pyrophosphatase [Gammaproteobacteria bacterium]